MAKIIIIFTVVLNMMLSQVAFADSSFRCGKKIVSVNDSIGTVQSKCGDPDSSHAWTEERTQIHNHAQVNVAQAESDFMYNAVSDSYEEWVYDMGTTQMTRSLKFKNGTLINISTVRD